MSANIRIIMAGLESADDVLLTLRMIMCEKMSQHPEECQRIEKLVKESRKKVHEGLREAVALNRTTNRNRKDEDYE